MKHTIPWYNPRQLSWEELQVLFVGREALLEEILTHFERQASSTTRQHWLIRGARGSGKSYLSAMVYHRVKRDKRLKTAFLPIWLPEAEIYTIFNAGILLQRIAEQLIQAIKPLEPIDYKRLKEELHQCLSDNDEDTFFDALLDMLKHYAHIQNKTLLILVENLDALLDAFAPQERRSETRRLRSLLLHEPTFLFFSTTPTNHLKALDDPAEPLYGHLLERKLLPLSETDTTSLLRKGAQLLASKDLSETNLQHFSDEKLHTLHWLTGGLPRSIVMAVSVLIENNNMESTVGEFETLLDANTAYFEARLAQLPPRERVIVTAMAGSEENLTSQEIAQLTRLPERSLSTLINRLEENGHLTAMGKIGGKGTVYALSDGLFRLWWPYRQGHSRLEPLIRFLAHWVSSSDLKQMETTLQLKMKQTESPLEQRLLDKSCQQISAALEYIGSNKYAQEQALFEESRDSGASESQRPSSTKQNKQSTTNKKHFKKAVDLYEKGYFEQALEILNTVISALGKNNDEPILLAKALGNKAATLRQLGQGPEAFQIDNNIVKNLGNSDEPKLQLVVANAIWNQSVDLCNSQHFSDALSLYEHFIPRFSRSRELKILELVLQVMINQAILWFDMGKHQQAIQACEKAIQFAPRSKNPDIQYWTAVAWFNKAIVFNKLNHQTQAISTYTAFLEHFQKSENIRIKELVARAMLAQATILRNIGKLKQALCIYDDLNKYFGQLEITPIQILVSTSIFDKAVTLSELGQLDESLSTYQVLLKTFEESKIPEVQIHISTALWNQGLALQKNGYADKARTVYEQFINKSAQITDPAILELLPQARFNLAGILNDLGEHIKALDIYNLLISNYKALSPLPTQTVTAQSWINKALILVDIGQPEEALNTCDHILSILSMAETTAELHTSIANALLLKAGLLLKKQQGKEAWKYYQQIITLFGDNPSLPMEIVIAQALFNQAVMFEMKKEFDSALQLYNRILERFKHSKHPKMEDVLSDALLNKTTLLWHKGKKEDAFRLWSEFQDCFQNFELQLRLINAILNLAQSSEEKSNFEDSLQIYEQLFLRFNNSYPEPIPEILLKAKLVRTLLLSQADHREESELLMERWVKEVLTTSYPYAEWLFACRHDLFLCFNLANLKKWFQKLRDHALETSQNTIMFLFVTIIKALDAWELRDNNTSQESPEVRYQKVMARVPLELRSELETIIEQIRQQRKAANLLPS